MNTDIIIPKLYEDMQGAVIVGWQKNIGEKIEYGDEIFSIETEKSVFEIEAEEDGVLVEIIAESGTEVKTLEVIGRMKI